MGRANKPSNFNFSDLLSRYERRATILQSSLQILKEKFDEQKFELINARSEIEKLNAEKSYTIDQAPSNVENVSATIDDDGGDKVCLALLQQLDELKVSTK